MTRILDTIDGPEQLKTLSPTDLETLAQEMRQEIIETVALRGGHLAPNLGTIEKGPFYAIEVKPGAIGTKGGARTDGDGRVLRPDGTAIAGLYAAGNVMAGVTGAGYPGAGATIGAAMTFGYLAGRHAAASSAHKE